MKKILSMLVISLVLLSTTLLAPLTYAATATVWTDKGDYSTYETATIFGSGFEALANVTVTIERPDGTNDTVYAVTDNVGSFTCTYQLNGIEGTYTVTATDGTNTATTTFVDRKWSVSVSPTAATVPQGGSTTATVTVTASPTGGPEVDLWATGQPTGVTVSFSPTKGTANFTSTMSISVSLTTTPGTYPIDIIVFTGKPGEPSYSEKARTTFTLTVTAIPPATVSITITSSPVTGSGFVKVDDNPITTPTTFTWTTGSKHKLEALSPVLGGTGTQYVYTSWSDGGGQTHNYTVPGSAATVTANYKTQYQITVTASPAGAIGGTFKVTYTQCGTTHTDVENTTEWTEWVDENTNVTVSEPETPVGGSDTRYVFDHYDPSNSVNMTEPKTITLVYKTQYYLTVVSPYDTPHGEGWYDNCTYAYAWLDSGIDNITPKVRAVFINWTGDASGTGLVSNPIHMNGPKTAIASWMIQYYLDVVTDPSNLPPIPGADWYDNCTGVELTAPTYFPNETGVDGVRYEFSYWDVDGTSQDMGVNPIDIHMDTNHTATAHYTVQYYLTLTTNPPAVNTPSGEGWYDEGTDASISTDQYVDIVPGSSRYRFDGWTTADMSEITDLDSRSLPATVHMDKAKTVTANYVIQYYLTVATVPADLVTIPGEDWYDNCTGVELTAPPVTGYLFVYWDLDGASQGNEVNPITVHMNASHTATAHHGPAVKHDISIISVTTSAPYDPICYPGSIVNITVVVKNNGDVSETFNVTAYRDNIPIGTILITNLGAGENTTIVFQWNTSGLTPCQTWTIKATAPLVGDDNPGDNTLTGGTAKITMLVDLNSDGIIDIFDLVIVGLAFGSRPGDPNWNPKADLRPDNLIDIFDLVIVGVDYGKKCL